MMGSTTSGLVPQSAVIMNRVQESPTIFTLEVRLEDEAAQSSFGFTPGQFNMLYLSGVGEVPISIMSDPEDSHHLIGHTIRALGRVTKGLAKLQPGERVGLRGPFGRGWPMDLMRGKDVVVITGGLGCAPVVAVIHYMLRRRSDYGRLTIIQGVKKAEDLIWREQYSLWNTLPDTHVMVSSDEGGAFWPGHVGRVTDLFSRITMDAENTVAVLCGPEGMMRAATQLLLERGLPEASTFLSMERNMQCAVGYCGHCQFGSSFVCRHGPVFAWPQVRDLMQHRGF
ncbi:MAG: FAD/NAD(P)-binding protein [Thiobacillaceae bacterium]